MNIHKFLFKYTKEQLAKELKISRVTLNTRLEFGNWRKKEIDVLLRLEKGL